MILRCTSVYLKKPSLNELKYTEELLSCKKTMSFNIKWGGTVSFPEEQWEAFYEKYLTDKTENVYFHIYNNDNIFLGEVSSRYQGNKKYTLNIKVKHEHRGNKYAYDTLVIYLGYLFNELNAKTVVDDVASDNIGAIKLLKSVGFKIQKQTEDITYMYSNNSK